MWRNVKRFKDVIFLKSLDVKKIMCAKIIEKYSPIRIQRIQWEIRYVRECSVQMLK